MIRHFIAVTCCVAQAVAEASNPPGMTWIPGGNCHNPAGPTRSFNPREPHTQQRVTKGGSFLCAENYCLNYRPSARRETDCDTGMSHLGFRSVLSPGTRDPITPKKSPK